MSQKAQSAALKRVKELLDDGSFVELGSYVTARNTDFNMATAETPADGVLTGYGTIYGNLVYVYSQDAAVLAGSMGEMHAKKIAHIYGQALKMGAPVIGFIDCAGLRLQEATDALDAFGKLYSCQAMASGVVPQIQAIFGNCGGGMAVSAGLSDFTFMESKTAKLFVNAPNAVAGNHEDKLDTAASKFQAEEAGIVDFVDTEKNIIKQIKALINILPANNEDDLSYDKCKDDLNRLVKVSANDPAASLTQISDNGLFVQVKAAFAPEMITGFIRLNGNTIGAIANKEDKLTVNGCEKAASFVNFCDAFNIPVVTLTNVTGYAQTMCMEKKGAQAVAKLTYAFANASVPKVNVITGSAYGTAYLTMNSQSIGADMVYAWPTATIGMMDAKQAAKIICQDGENVEEVAAEYASLQSSAVAAAKRGYVDDIIEPTQTRQRLIAAFEMLFTKKEDRPAKKHGAI